MSDTQIKKAVVLLSGGLDSTTVLAHAQSKGYECYAISFDYAQRHQKELEAAKNIAQHFKVREHKIVDCFFLSDLGQSSLTDKKISVPKFNAQDTSIPSTYVPARNTIFLSLALGWAEVLGAQAIFIGVSSVDYSGYPDCRPEFIQAYQQLADQALKRSVEGDPIEIIAPLVHLSKAQTISLGQSLGVDYSLTISCYNFVKDKACGVCDSCLFRAQGFSDAGVVDPTDYEKQPNLSLFEKN